MSNDNVLEIPVDQFRPGELRPTASGAVVVNPKAPYISNDPVRTFVGAFGPGTLRIAARGLWSAGNVTPKWVGPVGAEDASWHEGPWWGHKWYLVVDFFADPVAQHFAYSIDPMCFRVSRQSLVHAYMYDNLYTDNEMHPTASERLTVHFEYWANR